MANITEVKVVDGAGTNVATVDATGALKVAATVTVGAASPVTANAAANVTVGVTSGTVLAANANRKGLVLVNVSTAGQRVSLSFDGTAAVLDKGVTLYAGSSFSMDGTSLTVGAIAGIASAASALVSIQEYQ